MHTQIILTLQKSTVEQTVAGEAIESYTSAQD